MLLRKISITGHHSRAGEYPQKNKIQIPACAGMTKFLLIVLGGILTGLFPPVCLSEELRNVKAPVSFPRPFMIFIIIGLALILAGGMYLAYRWFWRKRNDGENIAVVSPWEKALAALRELAQSGLLEAGNIKVYYVRLSEIIRHYLEDRFQLRAPEMTTEEFLAHMKGARYLNDEQKKVLMEFLQMSDLVKFAKYMPTPDETGNHFRVAQTLIDQTRLREASPAL